MKHIKLFEEMQGTEPAELRLARLGLATVRVMEWSISPWREAPESKYFSEVRCVMLPNWPKRHTDWEELESWSDYYVLYGGHDRDSPKQMAQLNRTVSNAARYWGADWIHDLETDTWSKGPGDDLSGSRPEPLA